MIVSISVNERDANIVSIVAETEPLTWVRLAMTATQAQQLADRLDAALAARKEAMP